MDLVGAALNLYVDRSAARQANLRVVTVCYRVDGLDGFQRWNVGCKSLNEIVRRRGAVDPCVIHLGCSSVHVHGEGRGGI